MARYPIQYITNIETVFNDFIKEIKKTKEMNTLLNLKINLLKRKK